MDNFSPPVDLPKMPMPDMPMPNKSVDEPFVPHTPVLPPGPLLINNEIEEKYDIKPFKSEPKKNRVRKVSRSTRIRKSIAKEENKINRSKKRIESLNKKLSQQLKKDKKRKPKKMSKKQRRAIQKQIKSLKKKLSLKGGNGCKPVVQ